MSTRVSNPANAAQVVDHCSFGRTQGWVGMDDPQVVVFWAVLTGAWRAIHRSDRLRRMHGRPVEAFFFDVGGLRFPQRPFQDLVDEAVQTRGDRRGDGVVTTAAR